MMTLAVLLNRLPKADAESGFFSANCTTSGCHAASPSTCDGCHAHGVHSGSAKSNINIAGTLNKTTYAPGETVSVTIDGGYRTGWVRAILYDQNMNELARSTGTSTGGKGGGPAFPTTLSAPAPSSAGTYTWRVSWYGNKYDKTSPVFQATCSSTVTTNCWKPAANPNHGEEIRSLAAFTVSAAGDTTAPVVTAFSIPGASSSLTVSITTLTATDAVGVTGYLVNESSTKPSAGAAGWTGSAPASYTFGSAGAKTLYAWAKDAAGNVSNSMSADVTITVSTADTTPPSITVFNVPSVVYSLKAPITELKATDNVGVTGYIVKKSPLKPSVTDERWRSTAPTSVTLPDGGSKTLYAWAKDAAGNISEMASMTVVCRLSAEPRIIPVPASQEAFAYSATSFPKERGNIAKAKPLGIGLLAEGGNFDLQASIGPFSGPVDVYVTLYAPETAGSMEPLAVYYLRPDNSFEALSTVTEPWKQGVTDVNEHIADIPAGDLVPGPYILGMTITPEGSREAYYKWSTSFIVP